MKKLLIILSTLGLLLNNTFSQQPEPGIYSGYITVTRSNAALRLRDVTTLLITAEIYRSGSASSLLWTARNFDQTQRLSNPWIADLTLDYSSLQQAVPDFTFPSSSAMIPGGTTVPGSFKMTAKSLTWRCTSTGTTSSAQRHVKFSTTFSISRVGPAPAPDPAP